MEIIDSIASTMKSQATERRLILGPSAALLQRYTWCGNVWWFARPMPESHSAVREHVKATQRPSEPRTDTFRAPTAEGPACPTLEANCS
jgi:hypothetical protein